MARFGAQLNGLNTIEFLQGDLFAPVQGQLFDLVVMNPPFVISPVKGPTWARRRPARRRVLSPGGARGAGAAAGRRLLQLIGTGYRLRARIGGRRWRVGSRVPAATSGCCTAHVRSRLLRRFLLEPRHGEKADDRAGVSPSGMAYYETGAHRGDWLRRDRHAADERPGELVVLHPDAEPGACGDAIRRGFALRDFLETTRDDQALLATRVRLAPDLRWEQQLAQRRTVGRE